MIQTKQQTNTTPCPLKFTFYNLSDLGLKILKIKWSKKSKGSQMKSHNWRYTALSIKKRVLKLLSQSNPNFNYLSVNIVSIDETSQKSTHLFDFHKVNKREWGIKDKLRKKERGKALLNSSKRKDLWVYFPQKQTWKSEEA